jgi:hypothetical protein
MKLGVERAGALTERIAALRGQIGDAAHRAGRDPASVELVGVTKGQSRETVIEAVRAGLTAIGESYVQEAQAKYDGVTGAVKHFIGHVQTNKARAIVAGFDVIQTVDRIEAGRAIARAAGSSGKAVSTLVQVRIDDEKQFGVEPERAGALARELRAEGLSVDGVMAIGPNSEDPHVIRNAFRRAAGAFAEVGGGTLSIGMSNDWREAVACGSTMLRIGTALFGERT